MKKILYSILLTSIFGVSASANAGYDSFDNTKNEKWVYKDSRPATGDVMQDLRRSGYMAPVNSDDDLDFSKKPDNPKVGKWKRFDGKPLTGTIEDLQVPGYISYSDSEDELPPSQLPSITKKSKKGKWKYLDGKPATGTNEDLFRSGYMSYSDSE